MFRSYMYVVANKGAVLCAAHTHSDNCLGKGTAVNDFCTAVRNVRAPKNILWCQIFFIVRVTVLCVQRHLCSWL